MSEFKEKQISSSDAFEEMKAGVAVYLDVRTQEEFAQGSPEGSINMPVMNNIDGNMTPNENFIDQVKEKLSLDQMIVVGCKTGGRSQKACKLLLEVGFKDISNVIGGYAGTPYTTGWLSSNLPIQR